MRPAATIEEMRNRVLVLADMLLEWAESGAPDRIPAARWKIYDDAWESYPVQFDISEDVRLPRGFLLRSGGRGRWLGVLNLWRRPAFKYAEASLGIYIDGSESNFTVSANSVSGAVAWLAERIVTGYAPIRSDLSGLAGSGRRMGPDERHTEMVVSSSKQQPQLTAQHANLALDVLEAMTQEDEAQHALEQARLDLKYGQDWQDDNYIRTVQNHARRAAIAVGRAQSARQQAEGVLEAAVGLPANEALQLLADQRPELLALPPKR